MMLSELATSHFWLDLAEITGINILLSGDNAVVIALASRALPARQRNLAVLGGSAAAIGLRVVFCLAIVWLLAIPYLKLAGGLLLLWIGIKLIQPEAAHGQRGIKAGSNLFSAIRTIMVADAVMSLDNVVAIVAVAKGSMELIVLGLLISVPMIVFGSQLVLKLLTRFPILVTLGGGLLGWIAGEIIASDPAVQTRVPLDEHLLEQIAQPVLAALVIGIGSVLAWRTRVRSRAPVDLATEDRR